MDDQLISELIEAGTPAALVAKVAMEIGRLRGIAEQAQAPDRAAENRRAYDRDRKAKQRLEVRMSGGSPVESADIVDTNLDKESFPQTPIKKINLPQKVSSIARTRGNRISEGWKPEPFTPGTVAFESIQAWEPGKLERELSKFRDHFAAASGPSSLKQDWQAAWRKWVTQANEWTGNGRRNSPEQPKLGRTAEASVALRERISQLGHGGIPGAQNC